MLLDHLGNREEIITYSAYGEPTAREYLEGDIDGDGSVGLTDFSLVTASLGSSMGTSANYDARADFNRDGSVSLADYNIVSGAFGATAPPIARDGISNLDNVAGYAGYIWEPDLGGTAAAGMHLSREHRRALRTARLSAGRSFGRGRWLCGGSAGVGRRVADQLRRDFVVFRGKPLGRRRATNRARVHNVLIGLGLPKSG